MLSASGDDHLDGNRREGTGRSGLYVDVENLKADGRAMVQGLSKTGRTKHPGHRFYRSTSERTRSNCGGYGRRTGSPTWM